METLVIIGGGVAGSASAIWAAREGHDVLLVERETAAHDKVCGEFISIEAQHALRDLGLDLPACGAEPVAHLCLSHETHHVRTRLPFTGQSLSRRILDERLLQQAASAGVRVRRGEHVTGLVQNGGAWHIRLQTGETLCATSVFLATGKHDLRAWPRAKTPQHNRIGFKMHFRRHQPSENHPEHHVLLALLKDGYIGLEPVEDNKINLCLLVSKDFFAACGKRWDRLLARLCQDNPLVAQELNGTSACWPRPLAISGVPYGYMAPADDGQPPHLYRLGDQAAVIPSLCGDGLAMALFSAHQAVFYHRNRDAAGYHRCVRNRFKRQMRYARVLSWFAQTRLTQRFLIAMTRQAPGVMRFLVTKTRSPFIGTGSQAS